MSRKGRGHPLPFLSPRPPPISSLFGMLILISNLSLVLPSQYPPIHESEIGYIYDNSIPSADTARCFSCMSRLYEPIWPVLSNIYKKPRNFTDQCDDDSLDPSRVPVVNCPTICVSMVEEPNIAGVRVRGFIRGCMNDLLIGGFNQSIVGWYRWMHRDSCRSYRKKELFMLPGPSTDDSQIEVCTCYADHCNGNSPSSAQRPLLIPSIMIGLLLMLRL